MAAAKAAASAAPARVLVTGASGMVGMALIDSLLSPRAGVTPTVARLVRHESRSADEVYWDPYEMRIDIDKMEGFDAVVHLAGENIGSGESGLNALTGRWTERKKHNIMESRRRGTQLLSKTLAALKSPPKVLVSASGVGYYGSRGSDMLDEGCSKGKGFLSDVASVWESETSHAAAAGVRVVNMRFGVVMSNRGGVVQKLYLPYLFGLGGPVGPGTQYMSWISLGDAVRAITHAIQRPELEGPVNACAPEPCTSAEFASAFGAALARPAFCPLPSLAVRTVFGEMGEETLLVSQRAVPAALVASGFTFRHPDIGAGLKAALDYHGGADRV